MIRNVVFDLGGVLIDWDPRYVFRKIFSTEKEVEDFLQNVCNSAWNEKQDEGRTFEEAVAELSGRFPHHAKHIQTYNEKWAEMISGPIQSTVEVLERLKKQGKYRLLGLSNWSHEKFPYAEENFPFLKNFEHIVVSGRVRMKKPEPGIFLHLIEKCQIRPQESVFIDDVLANIKTAEKLDFQTIHFDRNKNLTQELTKKGVTGF